MAFGWKLLFVPIPWILSFFFASAIGKCSDSGSTFTPAYLSRLTGAFFPEEEYSDCFASCARKLKIWVMLYIPSVLLMRFLPSVGKWFIYFAGALMAFLAAGSFLSIHRARSAMKTFPSDLRHACSPIVWAYEYVAGYSVLLLVLYYWFLSF